MVNSHVLWVKAKVWNFVSVNSWSVWVIEKIVVVVAKRTIFEVLNINEEIFLIFDFIDDRDWVRKNFSNEVEVLCGFWVSRK